MARKEIGDTSLDMGPGEMKRTALSECSGMEVGVKVVRGVKVTVGLGVSVGNSTGVSALAV